MIDLNNIFITIGFSDLESYHSPAARHFQASPQHLSTFFRPSRMATSQDTKIVYLIPPDGQTFEQRKLDTIELTFRCFTVLQIPDCR